MSNRHRLIGHDRSPCQAKVKAMARRRKEWLSLAAAQSRTPELTHMSAPDLPSELKIHLASPGMRNHNATWHFVRAKWKDIDNDRRRELTKLKWNPPRLLGDSGSGIDFLGMHGMMVAHT